MSAQGLPGARQQPDSPDSGCGELMIWCRSVSMISYTMHTSLGGWGGWQVAGKGMTMELTRPKIVLSSQ